MGGLLKLSNQSNAFAYKEGWFGVEQWRCKNKQVEPGGLELNNKGTQKK
jgi:hypothetical protein